MNDQPDTEIEITTRPFFGDMLAPSAPSAQISAAAPESSRARENHHLLAAVTGSRPPLHIVDDEEAPPIELIEDAEAEPLRPRSRRRGTDAIRPAGYLQVDWSLVKRLTKELTIADESSGRSRGSFDVATASAEPENELEERTMVEIHRIIDRHTTRTVGERGADFDWTELTRSHYAQAMFDQAHRFGRLQQYLREEEVEDVSVVGFANVVVTKTTGIREKRSPIAENDKDLEDLISEIASYRGRTFAKPSGHLDLDIGGARLSATGVGITSVTNATIRKHNLVDITLEDMVKHRTISPKIARFLAAVSRANMCVFVAGFPGAGKTTMLRALMSTIRPEEKIVTIETERELYLNKLPERHWQVQDLQYVPSQAAGADSIAGFSLQQCLDIALRSSAERILFAEIRGAEGPIALKAMQAGKGSMSTIHARSADDAIHRFADVLMSELGLSDDTVPLRQIMRSIDIILYIDFIDNADGTRRRVITEVTEVRPNDFGQPMAKALFKYDPDRDSWSNPEEPTPQLEAPLRRVGYDWEKETRA